MNTEALFNNIETFAVEVQDGKTNPITHHFHPFYEFYYLCKGEVDYLVDGKIYSVKRGDLVIIPANKLHKTIAKNTSTRKRINLYLNQNYLGDEFSKYYSLPSSGVFHLSSNNHIPTILLSLLSEYENEKNELMVKSLIYQFLILLSRCKNTEKEALKSTQANNPIQKTIDYIHREYTSNITLSSAAGYSFLNESYLSRNFKKHTGFTFSEYLNNYRIQAAIKLLEDTTKNVSEIATAVGFNSLNHFCKTFKSHIGCSPLNYRKQLIK